MTVGEYYVNRRTILPLPEGEGRGEGEALKSSDWQPIRAMHSISPFLPRNLDASALGGGLRQHQPHFVAGQNFRQPRRSPHPLYPARLRQRHLQHLAI